MEIMGVDRPWHILGWKVSITEFQTKEGWPSANKGQGGEHEFMGSSHIFLGGVNTWMPLGRFFWVSAKHQATAVAKLKLPSPRKRIDQASRYLKCCIMAIINQPPPGHVAPPRNSRPYEGLIDHWFPLRRPKIKPLFLGGYVRGGLVE